jgi:hypothetical protein
MVKSFVTTCELHDRDEIAKHFQSRVGLATPAVLPDGDMTLSFRVDGDRHDDSGKDL